MDVVALGTEVVVTGVSRVDDAEHEYRFLDASGRWAGGTTRDDQVPYRQALQIFERLGDQAGMATCGSRLGTLAMERRQYAEATGWHIQALLVWLRLQVPEVAYNARALVALLVHMGDVAFVAAASTVVDDAQLAEVQAVLDSLGTDNSSEPEAE